MKLTIEITLGDNVLTGPDVAEIIRHEFSTFQDGNEPLQLNERGPLFDRENGETIGKWEVVKGFA